MALAWLAEELLVAKTSDPDRHREMRRILDDIRAMTSDPAYRHPGPENNGRS
jgi:hypothetical protein